VPAPQTGYLWTPGYWSFNNGGFGWNAGFWAAAVGFYGGINYGSGYYGHGYVGGQWADDTFRYNTAVTRVDTTNITNVYVDRAVVVENQGPSVSYHGGPHGVQANPSPQELQVVHAPHLPPTAIQVQHVQAAAQDRRLLATVNHNAPPITAVAKPLSPETHPEGFVPVTPADRVKVPARAVPAYHAPVQIAPHTVPQVHTVAPQAVPPVVHSAPPRVVPQVNTTRLRRFVRLYRLMRDLPFAPLRRITLRSLRRTMPRFRPLRCIILRRLTSRRRIILRLRRLTPLRRITRPQRS